MTIIFCEWQQSQRKTARVEEKKKTRRWECCKLQWEEETEKRREEISKDDSEGSLSSSLLFPSPPPRLEGDTTLLFFPSHLLFIPYFIISLLLHQPSRGNKIEQSCLRSSHVWTSSFTCHSDVTEIETTVLHESYYLVHWPARTHQSISVIDLL